MCTHKFKNLKSHPSSSINLRSISQQYSYDVGLVSPGCQMQRGLAPNRRHVRVGLVLQEEYHDVHAPHETRHVKGRQARLQQKTQKY